MNEEKFSEILESRILKIREILGKKAGEYARNGDRLSNFKRAAAMLKSTPEKALVGAWSKHLTSILDMVDDLTSDVHSFAPMWEEKIGDAINYLILLEALLEERYESLPDVYPGKNIFSKGKP